MDATKMILLVEDNADDEALALRAFRHNQMNNPVVVVRDGAEALDYLFAVDSAQPAVIFLDLKLPKVDGLEVLRRIRSDERTRLAPVVILTSSREDGDILSSYRLGANSYVRKPVNFDEFLMAVHQLGTYWLGLNEAPPLAC